jgi:hypothetical protein
MVALILIVPIAVALPLIVAALVAFAVLTAVVGTVALALSPLLLIGWLAWRLTRPSRRAPASPP